MDNNITLKFRSFESQILYMNGMYSLPVAYVPSIKASVEWQQKKYPQIGSEDKPPQDWIADRLRQLKVILSDELNEIDDIISKLEKQEYPTDLDFLVDMADLMCDIQIYCASENARFGIPNPQVLNIIMQSNFSKLGEDGKPIIQDGKIQKGPHYWKPEPKIAELFTEIREDFNKRRPDLD